MSLLFQDKKTRADHLKKLKVCKVCTNENQKGRHLHYGTRLYFCWNNMKQRCSNKKASGYKNYGAIGVRVCREWEAFIPFKEWALENGYKEDLEIDRIVSSGNYEPSNCRWVTESIQSRNTRLIHKTNKTGFRGVSIYKNRFRAGIQVDKKRIELGYFDNPKDGALAYDEYIIANKLEHTKNFKYSAEDYKNIAQTYKNECKELE